MKHLNKPSVGEKLYDEDFQNIGHITKVYTKQTSFKVKFERGIVWKYNIEDVRWNSHKEQYEFFN